MIMSVVFLAEAITFLIRFYLINQRKLATLIFAAPDLMKLFLTVLAYFNDGHPDWKSALITQLLTSFQHLDSILSHKFKNLGFWSLHLDIWVQQVFSDADPLFIQ